MLMTRFWPKEVVKEKTDDGKDTMKITIRAPRFGRQASSPPDSQSAAQARPVRPVSPTGQTGSSSRSDRSCDRPRTFKPKRPEVGTWKTNEVKVPGRTANQKPTFNQLLNKYTKVVQKDRPLKKETTITAAPRSSSVPKEGIQQEQS